MSAATEIDSDALARLIGERRLGHVKLGVTDIDGIMRGKYVAAADVLANLSGGLGFCNCIVGWDCDDTLYDGDLAGISGWQTGFADIPVNIVPATARMLPGETRDAGLLVLGELGAAAAAVCPRTVLRRVVEQANVMGYAPLVGFEYEFGLFAETPESARAKGFRGLTPLSPGNFGYSLLRAATHSEFCEALLAECEMLGTPLVALHTENGPGFWEAAIAATDALAAADRAAIFRLHLKAFAQRHGLLATFMAKWSVDHQGQGGHIHISLRAKADDEPLFLDPAGGGSTPLMDSFVAGQLTLLPEMAALYAPTVNSYTRLVPGAWAPTAATVGEDNRTCALRLVGRSPKSRRVEVRVPGADANPYLALAAALASGLHGICDALPPAELLRGNAYLADLPDKDRLPATLSSAAGRLRTSGAARAWFGDRFVEHFATTRDWEESRFRAVVTNWELERYFEVI